MRRPQDPQTLQSPILLLAAVLLFISVPTLPDPVGAQVVRGHLYDSETGGPVINGNVALRDSFGAIVVRTATDEGGAYRLTAPSPGVYRLLAVGMGYRSTPTGDVELLENEVTTIDIFLHPQPLELDTLSVETRRQRIVSYLKDVGFYNRQRTISGSFLTPEQIRRWPAISVLDVLRHAPFVTYELNPTKVYVPDRGFGALCQPALYVDGMEVRSDLEWVVRPEDVVGVEVYRGLAQIPLQWAFRETCGVILIWTNLGGQG